MFKIIFQEGNFFKILMDFIHSCTLKQPSCFLSFKFDGIYLEDKYMINNNKLLDNEKIKRFPYMFLDCKNFIVYDIEKEVKLSIEPKKLHKLCGNLNKKDKLIIEFVDSKLILTVNYIDRHEKKFYNVDNWYEILNNQQLIKDNVDKKFSTRPFILKSEYLLKFKKNGNTSKNHEIEVFLNTDRFLQLRSNNLNIGPIISTYKGDETDSIADDEYISMCKTKLKFDGPMITMLVKLSGLTTNIKWYEKLEDNDMIKISANLDIPTAMGYIEIYIQNV